MDDKVTEEEDGPQPGSPVLGRAEEAADFLKAIANPNRLLILCALAEGRIERSVGDLEESLGVRQPTLSQQLARLREDGLVETRREGKSIFYRLNNPRAAILVMLLYDWFCREPDTPSK